MGNSIEINNLSYRYPDGTLGLSPINFTVGFGEILTIIGANGTGKSTLLAALMGIIDFQGNITVEGLPLTKSNLKSIRRKMNLLFQNPDDQLFSPTVWEDVTFGPLNLGWAENKVNESAYNALTKVRMQNHRNRITHHLSFGEKKRVALATILAMEPSILLLDEPTSGLDPRSAAELVDVLYQLHKEGKTLLVATHDLHTADEFFSRVIVLGESKTIVKIGTHIEILNDHQLLVDNNLIHQHIHRHDGQEHIHEHIHFQHREHHR